TGCGEGFITPVLVTNKGPVSCVDTFVPDEITKLSKTLVAPILVTEKWPVIFSLSLKLSVMLTQPCIEMRKPGRKRVS
ncbi:hypothetical protein, partial [Sansalvadorimonas verongulae]|uniref:hypothetical protein n=1 Tax=Sansalvadorimonas verongulae TaxID=2172824 RepID=UPI001E5D9E3A